LYDRRTGIGIRRDHVHGYGAVVIDARLIELGIELPPPMPPAGTYVACVVDGDLVHVGGHGPVAGDVMIRGKVGGDLTLEQGRDAARMTALSILATLREHLGTLDRIERIVKVFGMVNVAPGFDRMPAVIDGCSDLLVEVFGEAGRHTRSAVGLASLPFGIAVEIELIARLRPS
jgi:enamine deaminase RidA (YjgF/YER057c/UK114 family)